MPYYNLDHLDAVTRLIADLGISVDDDGHVGDDGSTYYGGFIQKGGETLSFTVRQPQGAGTSGWRRPARRTVWKVSEATCPE